MENNKTVISALVRNQTGVLLRVSGLFTRRGFNIDSLTVCRTENPEFSRMTIVIKGDFITIRQVIRQLDKLEDVDKIIILDSEASSNSELLLIKIPSSGEKRAAALKSAQVYGAKVLDIGTGSITFELTGQSAEIDEFIEHMGRDGILELARTGITALGAGDETIYD